MLDELESKNHVRYVPHINKKYAVSIFIIAGGQERRLTRPQESYIWIVKSSLGASRV